jgi:[ribosomal protein S18]-alanine N-acetyltransferase
MDAPSRAAEPTLRPAVASDVGRLVTIERAAFSDPWPASSFRALLVAPTTRLTVAEVDGQLVGYSVVMQVLDEAELANIAVDASARRRGVGRRLLCALLDRATAEGVAAMYLEVRESNTAARTLYADHGFREVSRRRAYYRDPDEDALVLVWHPVADG